MTMKGTGEDRRMSPSDMDGYVLSQEEVEDLLTAAGLQKSAGKR